MSLETLVAGRYGGTYNSVDVGITEDGYRIQQDSSAFPVNNTDAYGDSMIDFIYRGGNAFMIYNSIAYKAGAITPFWPWGTLGVMFTSAAPLGRLASAVAAAMVITAVANTPAAAAPASVTAPLAILAPNSNLELLYTSKLRTVPTRLQLLPSLNTGTASWFT